MKSGNKRSFPRYRHYLVLAMLTLGYVALVGRAAQLQVIDPEYLQAEGNARFQRVIESPARRGRITDRNGLALAVSSPVDSVWVDPQVTPVNHPQWPALAELLDMPAAGLKETVEENKHREHAYLRRHLAPGLAAKVEELGIPGVYLQREYRRYYPGGPVFGQVLGFTDIDQKGQEGVERAFDDALTGSPGYTRVLKDRVGHVVEYVERISPTQDGEDLALSIDSRIQYLTYRHLGVEVRKHKASAGSAVVLDARNGEVLALVNFPSFNPNNREDMKSARYRNRAVTDVFEPGSTVKPFTIAAALLGGGVLPDTRVDTAPGTLRVGGHTIHDTRDYGMLTVGKVLVKSSNVGAAKLALQLDTQGFVDQFRSLGFGAISGLEFPGEATGQVPHRDRWRPIEKATLSYGYGMSATLLQLARAYTVLAGGGRLAEVSLLPGGGGQGERVYPREVTAQIAGMLNKAVSDNGTGSAARVDRYEVAGKTGTVHKLIDGAYADDRYLSVFAGFAPKDDPRLVMAIMIDDPRGEAYYGGKVAAPVFSRVIGPALYLLNVAPSKPNEGVMQASLDEGP